MPSRLSSHDTNILVKIQDPESSSSPILIDSTLPPDPNVTGSDYDAARIAERKIFQDIVKIEKERSERLGKLQKLDPDYKTSSSKDVRALLEYKTWALGKWLGIILKLDILIKQFPSYGSARGNRVQALTTLYGHGMIVRLYVGEDHAGSQGGLDHEMDHIIADGLPTYESNATSVKNANKALSDATQKVLADLAEGIRLLSPTTNFAAVSPRQAQNLANLHMQRGRLYKTASEKLKLHGAETETVTNTTNATLRNVVLRAKIGVATDQQEASWSSADFMEHASRDFFIASKYGNNLGKNLAVTTNPTAKLCGEMVKEAMRNEHVVREDVNSKDQQEYQYTTDSEKRDTMDHGKESPQDSERRKGQIEKAKRPSFVKSLSMLRV